MKLSFASLPTLVLLGATAPALSDCPAEGYKTLLDDARLETEFVGQAIDANAPDGENWKEIHCGTGTTGDLEKVGLGQSHPVDPQRKVGTWSIVDDTMRYDYGSGGTYTWRIYQKESDNDYCWQADSDGSAVIATGSTTSVPCLPTP
jgi:hypothetical protein